MPRTAVTTGFFGKIPAAGDFVSWNLPRAFTDRWDRWMSRDLIEHPSRGPLDPRAWRFTVPAGIFCDAPCAGVWRMSEDRAGRRYPFVIAGIGARPDPSDPWFTRVEGVVAAALVGVLAPQMIAGNTSRLGDPASGSGEEPKIAFWIDGPEVKEASFGDIVDLARSGLRVMRNWVPEEEEL